MPLRLSCWPEKEVRLIQARECSNLWLVHCLSLLPLAPAKSQSVTVRGRDVCLGMSENEWSPTREVGWVWGNYIMYTRGLESWEKLVLWIEREELDIEAQEIALPLNLDTFYEESLSWLFVSIRLHNLRKELMKIKLKTDQSSKRDSGSLDQGGEVGWKSCLVGMNFCPRPQYYHWLGCRFWEKKEDQRDDFSQFCTQNWKHRFAVY